MCCCMPALDRVALVLFVQSQSFKKMLGLCLNPVFVAKTMSLFWCCRVCQWEAPLILLVFHIELRRPGEVSFSDLSYVRF